jgi:hypothetical protein
VLGEHRLRLVDGAARPRGIAQQPHRVVGERGRRVAEVHGDAVDHVEPGDRGGRRHDRPVEGERLEHLDARAGALAQRHHHHVGVGVPRRHVGDDAGEDRFLAHLVRQGRARQLLQHLRDRAVREPLTMLHVVIERMGGEVEPQALALAVGSLALAPIADGRQHVHDHVVVGGAAE